MQKRYKLYFGQKGAKDVDFYKISERYPKKDLVEVYPDFKVCHSKDLMTRGKAFYAIWDEEAGLWSTDEYDVARIVDADLMRYFEDKKDRFGFAKIDVKLLSNFSSRSWKDFKLYISNISDNSHQLDTKIVFSNTEVKKNDYVSKRLNYPLEKGTMDAYDEIMRTLYDPEERDKIEWAIGAIISGDAKSIQKFLVFYGDPGTGKSTVLEIIQMLFDGYYAVFDAKSLTSSSNAFATEMLKNNPLLAIQHDGDLSRIEDNTRLNSIVSHEEIMVNEKYKAGYSMKMNCFLLMATNKPVKITDAKAGLIRRLIDVRPSGRKIPFNRYTELKENVKFELGAIAYHCLEKYKEMGKSYYSSYRPVDMMYKTDPFFNFVESCYPVFVKEDGVTLKQAYSLYKQYCDESNADYKLQMYKFREELKNYFTSFEDMVRIGDTVVRSYYSGFIKKKFEKEQPKKPEVKKTETWLDFKEQPSKFDQLYGDYISQYASEKGTPSAKWENVKTKLSDINTSKLHYVLIPDTAHIVVDFDKKGPDGKKSLEENIKEASKFPKTYAELSKSGCGIHLHYLYSGDVSKLSRVFDDNIEVKIFTGNSSLRRMLTKCNDLDIATINSGLPLKAAKGDKMVNFESIKNEKALRTIIKKNLNKEIHPGTKPSVDFIFKVLEDAYNGGIKYDVSDMYPAIMSFAANSSHQSDYCLKMVTKMKFKSEDPTENKEMPDDEPLIFYDVEVFPNLFLINWKPEGEDKSVVRMINPKPIDVEELMKHKLVGFNCRRYDNHILWARMMGYSNEQLYTLSQRLITGSDNATFSEAYNVSYTDVYDFASAGHKQSLKKFEIELGIHHQELGLPWDQPVPEELWEKVAEYCDNDVIATEATFNYLKADWTARQILADLAGMTVNDTTNTLTTKIIFGNNRHPQDEFNYRDLSKPYGSVSTSEYEFLSEACPQMMIGTHGDKGSLLPYFDGYTFDFGKSVYKDIEVGEGGYVFATPGIHENVALLDVASMHPHSLIAECLFGVKYTKAFRDIVEGRVAIKHEDWDAVSHMLDGKLIPYIQKIKNGEMKSKDLANALKTAINSVYGLTSAKFDNPFRDIRNKDNIVAKRGALFMVDLKEAVEAKGFTVAHIKTDSIKIPNATPEIIMFVKKFGERYGYTFEHEATYEKMCLVNNAVYIAKYSNDEKINGEHAGEWTATGTQFAVPYVFKTLFSKENIKFEDMCETKSVTSALYLDRNEGLGEDEHDYQFIGKVGSFCPMLPGCGAGNLVRSGNDGKYSAATGCKDYLWLEAEEVKHLNKEKYINKDYYNRLVDEAAEAISKYGDLEWFVA